MIKTNYKKSLKSLWTVMKSEFFTQCTSLKLIVIFFSILIPIMSITLMGDIKQNVENIVGSKDIYISEKIMNMSQSLLGMFVLHQGILYAVIIRIGSIFIERNIIDKNRLSFLKYNKHMVSFSKIFIDLLLFSIHIFVLMISGFVIVENVLSGELHHSIFPKVINSLLGYIFFYLFTSYGIRLIIVSCNKQWKPWVMFLWLSATIFHYIITLPLGAYWRTLLEGNVNTIKYIPFGNLIIPGLFLWEIIEDIIPGKEARFTYLLPMICTTIIFIGVTWNKFTTKQKEYLCA